MRIAVVGPTHPFKGGVAQHTTVLANRLAEAGHDVELVSWNQQYPQRLYPGVQEVSGDPEIPTTVPTARRLHWALPWTWAREGRRLRAADLVVIAHVTPIHVVPYLVLVRVGLRRSSRIAVICHNVLPHEPAPLERPLVRALLRSADLVVTHSPQQAALAEELISRPVVATALPPFGPRAFGRRGCDVERVTYRRLLFFGIVRPYKGLDLLLRAVAAGPADVAVRIAGEFWAGVEEYEVLCADLGIRERVEIIPEYVPAEAVPALFDGVDALVLPYRSATGSQGPMTAFEQGIPVISTDAGQLASEIRNGIDGVVVPANDAPALTAAIVDLYRPGRLAELRRNVHPPDEVSLWATYVETVTGGSDNEREPAGLLTEPTS